MRTLFPILILCSLFGAASAEAAQFRGVEFGSPCDEAAVYESEAGSEVVRLDPPFSYSFTGVFLDRVWEITYGCMYGGQLRRGTYSKSFLNQEAARHELLHAVERLRHELGAPKYDTADPEYKERFGANAFNETFGNSRIIRWETGGIAYSLAYGGSTSDETENFWVVVITLEPMKDQ